MNSQLPRFAGIGCSLMLAVGAHGFCALAARAEAPGAVPSTMVIDGLGKGAVPLDGPWQFHLGDNLDWAAPEIDDSTGHDGWEQLTADKTWGLQGHASYTGFGWYRKRIHVTPAPGAAPDFAMMVPGAIDDVYEIYWNGIPVGHFGDMPPHWHWIFGGPPQTLGLGPIRDGVLAVRVWKVPLSSNDDGTAGGFEAVPILGSGQAIASALDASGFRWLRGQQFRFGLTSLYALVALMSLIGWLRDRRQWLLFWMSIYALSPAIELALQGLGISYDAFWNVLLVQASIQVREISQWFVLIYLLQLNESERLVRLTTWVGWITFIAGTLDGTLYATYPSMFTATQMQIADAILTAIILPPEAIPALLVAYALFRRQRLDSARWVVAIIAFIGGAWYAVSNISAQGIRFTHWQLANNMGLPLFTVNHNAINMQLLMRTLLFLSFVYAVARYAVENRRRQAALEQEFQNAREVQQVLVPETLPNVPGFSLTSAYRPAQEVGGDFFQIVPLDDGATLIVLGDVSGKGLKAAMAVSLIVGAVQMIVEYTTSPAEILSALNRRLAGRMQEGFATCLAMKLNPDGRCTIASAGHPAPFLNHREVSLPGALPLGMSERADYDETTLRVRLGDHFALYTDGLLEARNRSGELYGFDRLATLFATRPDAVEATEAAVEFGQEDDITVLTLIRAEAGMESTPTITFPMLKRA